MWNGGRGKVQSLLCCGRFNATMALRTVSVERRLLIGFPLMLDISKDTDQIDVDQLVSEVKMGLRRTNTSTKMKSKSTGALVKV